MAISASKARLVSQCLCLLCRLYLGPFFSKVSSFLEKAMSVLFTNLRRKEWGSLLVVVCCWVSQCNLLSSVLYLANTILCSFVFDCILGVDPGVSQCVV
jgi:hypothetical protein